MPISKPHSSFGGNNTGSCGALVDYLDKENQELEKLSIKAKNKEQQVHFQERQQDCYHEWKHAGDQQHPTHHKERKP